MNSKKLIAQVKKDLMAKRDLEYQKGSINFFKEPINPIGVRAADTRRIAGKFYKDVKFLPKKEFFKICQELLKSEWMEPKTIAFDWLRRSEIKFQSSDWAVFEKWLKRHVSNWAHCDDFCTHAFGSLLYRFPGQKVAARKWLRSKNRWLRRAGAVIYIGVIKNFVNDGKKSMPADAQKFWKENLPGECFEIADGLLLDQDDLVQKGYGWMLKVVADQWEDEVFDYVIKKKNKMPRTALRYAIEKMPKKKKLLLMSKKEHEK